jgi:hypothetical protein
MDVQETCMAVESPIVEVLTFNRRCPQTIANVIDRTVKGMGKAFKLQIAIHV